MKQNLRVLVILFFLFCECLLGQSGPTLSVGTVIPKLACADPTQTYALYLPSTYLATRKWPIVYVFDPIARGQLAVETVKAAAEKFGYIVAASNNSRNGPLGGSAEAADAMWKDTHQRLAIDERRRYFAGMSGGARVATSLALSCQGCVAGVIANAAGFPVNAGPTRDMKFAYFAAVGNADFNYGEFVELRRRLADVNAHYRIRVFEGPHGWAPAEAWLEALNWMDLQAMSAGVQTRDANRSQADLNEDLARAHDFELKKDPLAAFREYQSIIRDYSTLVDVSTAKSRVAELQKDKSVKRAEKQELSDIRKQASMTAVASGQLQTLTSSDLTPTDLTGLRGEFVELKKEAEVASSANDSSVLVAKRALGGLVVEAWEAGQRAVEKKDYKHALLYFDLAAAGSRDPGWAHYYRARVFALASDTKNMLTELQLALKGESHDPSALDVSDFDKYRDSPEFQALAAEWKRKAQL